MCVAKHEWLLPVNSLLTLIANNSEDIAKFD